MGAQELFTRLFENILFLFQHASFSNRVPLVCRVPLFQQGPSGVPLLLPLLRGTARQHRIGPSWASNDAPSKDLSNMRALQHLAPLATDYWAPSHSFIEQRIFALAGIFKK